MGCDQWDEWSSDDGAELEMSHDKSSFCPISQQWCYLGALNVISSMGSPGPEGAVSLTVLAH